MSRIIASLLSGLLLAMSSSTVVRADDFATQATHSGNAEFSNSSSVAPKLKMSDALIDKTPFAPSDGLSRLGAPPHDTESIMKMMPKLGSFAVTFYSDMPVTGFDGMYNAEVVVSLTRKF